MSERGIVINIARSRQLVDMSGITYRWNVTATDFDCVIYLIELRDEVFIFIEYKYGDKELLEGQTKAFERLVDAISKPSIYIVARHDVKDVDTPIDGATCKVRKCRYDGEWHDLNNWQVKPLVDSFLKNKGLGHLII